MIEHEIPGFSGYFLQLDWPKITVYSSLSWSPRHKKILLIEGKRKPLTIRTSWNGYQYVELGGQKNKKAKMLHRIIAELYIPNPHNLECVDHIDGNKLNNHPSNLQWITRGDNVRKAQNMNVWGTPPKKYKITFQNKSETIIENISKFSRENDYSATKLVAVSKGRRKTHKDVIKIEEICNGNI